MKKLLISLSFLAATLVAQPPVRFYQGTAAPSSALCNASTAPGALYVRYDNPATNPSQVYVCTETGSSSFAWQFISHKVGSSAPVTCDVGEVFFNSSSMAGSNWYGCTSSNTWTLLGGGGGGSGNPGGYTTVTFSSTPTFTAASNTSTSFLLTLTGTVTSSTLASASTGQIITMNICQDGTGGRSFVPPTNVLNMGTVDGTANACSHQTFVYDGTNAQALGVMFVTGPAGGAINLQGSSSGNTILQPAAVATGTLILPAATDTLTGKATTDTLTHKTYDTAGIGNSFSINGTPITAVSGTGNTVCLSTGSACTGGSGWDPITSGTTIYDDLYGSCNLPLGTIFTSNLHPFWTRGEVASSGASAYACGTTTGGETPGLALSSAVGSGDYVQLYSSLSNYIAASSAVTWNFQERFQLASTTNEQFTLGLQNGPYADGIFVRYDTGLGDSAFNVCIAASSAVTCQSTTVAVDTNRHTILFHKVSSSQISVTLDSTVYTFNTGAGSNTGVNLFSQTFTTASVYLLNRIQTLTSGAKSLTLVFTRFEF